MAVFKRRHRGGKVVWCFVIDAPGSTRNSRRQIKVSGFPTKASAEHAEAERRVTEQQRYELEKAGLPDVPLPKTLADLLSDFFVEHAEKKLAQKTVERYRDLSAYLHPDLVAMPIADIRPLHLAKEWNRLLESGGRFRSSHEPRPLAAKTVRGIAGVVSTAFARAIRWGLVSVNPVPASEPPVPKRRSGTALTPAQQKLLVESASGCWCLAPFLELWQQRRTSGRNPRNPVVRYPGRGLVHLEVPIADEGRIGIQRNEEQVRQNGRAARVCDCGVECTSKRTGQLPRSIRLGILFQISTWSSPNRMGLLWSRTPSRHLYQRYSSVSKSRNRREPACTFTAFPRVRPAGSGHGTPRGVGRLGHSSVLVTATVYSHRITGRDKEAAMKWDEFQRSHEQPGPKQ